MGRASELGRAVLGGLAFVCPVQDGSRAVRTTLPDERSLRETNVVLNIEFWLSDGYYAIGRMGWSAQVLR